MKFPRGKRLLIDVFVALWVLGWMVMGALVGHSIAQLAELSRTLTATAGALEETGDAIHALERLPLVGERLARIADDVDATAKSARESAARSEGSIGRLSYLLGASVAVIPTAPLLVVYLPRRGPGRPQPAEAS